MLSFGLNNFNGKNGLFHSKVKSRYYFIKKNHKKLPFSVFFVVKTKLLVKNFRK